MATGFNPLGASAYSNLPRSAIIQPARDWRYYETTITNLDKSKGAVLREYKDSGVWREHYKTWEAACVPLEISRAQANALILREIEKPLAKQAESCHKPTDPKEATLNKVAALPPPEEPEKPHIRTADEIKAEQAETDKPPVDISGCPIPQHLIAGREQHLAEVRDAIIWASNLKCLFEDMHPHYTHVKASGNGQTFVSGASAMYSALRECLPEVVCPQCQAKAKTCHVCHGSGWISQVRWNRDWVKSHDAQRLLEVKRRSNGK